MANPTLRKILMALMAPVAALIVSVLITSAIVSVAGASPLEFWDVMLSKPSNRGIVDVLNQATMIFLAAIAAAIGFRMNLFNIGVEGQAKVASYVAAVVAGTAVFSGWVNVVVTILVAMVVGAAWAALPALLKVTRGVSEVISTIMLNSIATFLVGYLLNNYGEETSSTRRTTPVAKDSLLSGFNLPFLDGGGPVWTLSLVAVAVGIVYWVVVNWTRFGFDLRATGANESAAVASGVSVKRMVLISMAISGAVAGLIWLPQLFGANASGAYFSNTTFTAGLGFTGIAVALLGRNTSLGMAFGALLFAFLTVQAGELEFSGVEVSKGIIKVVQGVIVLSVVISYEVLGRWRNKMEQRAVQSALRTQPTDTTKEVVA